MNARLVRVSSTEPNIRNFDDAAMVRYAYGGDGIVKNFGNQLSISPDLYSVTIDTGRVVLHGWEVDVQSPIVFPLSLYESGKVYVYLEIDLSVETAEFKVLDTYSSSKFEELIPLGDDLTKNPFGLARLPIYSFSYSTNPEAIDFAQYLVPTLELSSNLFADIYEKLKNLGFREGAVTLVGSSTLDIVGGTNWLKRQGNFVIGSLYIQNLLDDFPGEPGYSGRVIGILPEGFKPLSTANQPQAIAEVHPSLLSYNNTIAVPVHLFPNGKIFVRDVDVESIYFLKVVLGYEAEPIK